MNPETDGGMVARFRTGKYYTEVLCFAGLVGGFKGRQVLVFSALENSATRIPRSRRSAYKQFRRYGRQRQSVGSGVSSVAHWLGLMVMGIDAYSSMYLGKLNVIFLVDLQAQKQGTLPNRLSHKQALCKKCKLVNYRLI